MAQQKPRIERRPLDGVLLLDKPCGMTSNTALQRARWMFRAQKGGHTGVLDPLATGLLPLCFGEATKFSAFLLDADKGYRATLRFGAVSSTLDREGEITPVAPPAFDREQLEAVIRDFMGVIDQVPPMYSALKFQGKALYEYARAGVEIERKVRQVTIHRIDLLAFDGETAVMDVACSKGTYIRTLAADIGERLGCVWCLSDRPAAYDHGGFPAGADRDAGAAGGAGRIRSRRAVAAGGHPGQPLAQGRGGRGRFPAHDAWPAGCR